MDRRAQKTQMAIRTAFLTLLGKKSLSKITVSEISQLADLGRGTFYLHYKDIYELYEYIEDDLYSEIERLIDQSCADSDSDILMNLAHMITEYIFKNRDTFLLVIGAGVNGRSLYKLKKLFNKKMILENPASRLSRHQEIECMFAVSGIIGVFEEWLFTRPELPQKQIAASLYKILQKFEL